MIKDNRFSGNAHPLFAGSWWQLICILEHTKSILILF